MNLHTKTIILLSQQQQQQHQQKQQQEQPKIPTLKKVGKNYSSHRIKIMTNTVFKTIASRAKYQLKLLNEGYSRGDSHRKHIIQRFTYFGSLNKDNGDYITCDKCLQNIEFDTMFFIHKRRSYNRFFHMDCAQLLKLL